MEKLVIYRGLSGLKVTAESNYTARIRNERRVTDCSEFGNAEEVKDYFCKYFGSKAEDFIDMTEEE